MLTVARIRRDSIRIGSTDDVAKGLSDLLAQRYGGSTKMACGAWASDDGEDQQTG